MKEIRKGPPRFGNAARPVGDGGTKTFASRFYKVQKINTFASLVANGSFAVSDQKNKEQKLIFHVS